MRSNWRIGLPLALTAAVLWGTLPLALTIVLRGMDAYTLTWFRFLIASTLLFAILGLTRNLPRPSALKPRVWPLLALATAGLTGNYVLFLIGLHYTSPTITQIVGQLSPLFLMFAGVLVFREHLAWLQRWGIAALLAGLLLFFNRRLPEVLDLSGSLGIGVALVIAGTLVWTLYGTSQKLLHSHLGAHHILLVLYIGSAIVLWPLASPGEVAGLDSLQLALLFFCGLNTLLAYGSFAESLKHWEVSRVGAVLATAPLYTIAAVWAVSRLAPSFVQKEPLNGLSIVGALMVVGGSALCALGGAPRTVVASQPVAEH